MIFQSLFNLFRGNQDKNIYDMVARLNAESQGGPPISETVQLGQLELPSRSIMIEDPGGMPEGLVISNLASDQGTIKANVLRYPSDSATIAQLDIGFPNVSSTGITKKLGELGIGSAAVVLADAVAVRDHWTETGLDRIGVVQFATNHKLRRDLKKKFKLKTKQVGSLRAETLEPVSEELEQEIEDYLKTIPEYSDYPFMHFFVQTNDSFDRVNYMNSDWKFLPIGNQPEPVMFSCGTGYGDGLYPVEGIIADDLVQSLKITFIDEETDLDDVDI